MLLGIDTNNVALPLSLTAQPNWLVPPGTNGLTMVAQAQPCRSRMDTGFVFGDPDFSGPSFGNAAVNRLIAPEVAPGFFFGTPGADRPRSGRTACRRARRSNLAAVANT